MTFGDNDKAIFGAGSDLQIYHDGSNSYIKENGTGQLVVNATNLYLRNSDNTQDYLTAVENGATKLLYSDVVKLATTSTGVDITGEIEANTAHFGTGTGTGTNVADEVVVSGTGSTGLTIHSPDASNATLSFGSVSDNHYGFVQGYYNAGSPFLRLSIQSSEIAKVTSTGIDVTGEITADGLTVNSGATNTAATFESTDQYAFVNFQDNTSTDGTFIGAEGNNFIVQSDSTKRLFQAAKGGDISYPNTPNTCLLYTSPSPRDGLLSRMPSSA